MNVEGNCLDGIRIKNEVQVAHFSLPRTPPSSPLLTTSSLLCLEFLLPPLTPQTQSVIPQSY